MPVLFLSRGGLLSHERALLERRGVQCVERTWDEMTLPFHMDPAPAACRWMLSPVTSLDAFAFQLAAIEALERAGTRIVNRPASVLASDKATMIDLWHRDLHAGAGPVMLPASLVTGDSSSAVSFLMEHGQVVIKPVAGQGSRDVVLVDVENTGTTGIVEGLVAARGPVVLQATVRDVVQETRTFVIDSTVVATIPRTGKATAAPVPDVTIEAIEMFARDVAATTRLDILAVDCIMDRGGTPWFIEWNPFPGPGSTGTAKHLVEQAITSLLHDLVAGTRR